MSDQKETQGKLAQSGQTPQSGQTIDLSNFEPIGKMRPINEGFSLDLGDISNPEGKGRE